MEKCICPNCGAILDKNGLCPYCGNSEDGYDYTSQLRDTKLKREIQELQKEINEEQKEIDELLKNHSPNGCLEIGLGFIIIALVIISAMIGIFRNGDGIGYILIGSVVEIPLVYTICKFCDSSGNEDIQEVGKHKRIIKKLTKEIENIQHGID